MLSAASIQVTSCPSPSAFSEISIVLRPTILYTTPVLAAKPLAVNSNEVSFVIESTTPIAVSPTLIVSPTFTSVSKDVLEPVTVVVPVPVVIVPVPVEKLSASTTVPSSINILSSTTSTFKSLADLLSTKFATAYTDCFCKSITGETFVFVDIK